MSSSAESSGLFTVPFVSLEYRDLADPLLSQIAAAPESGKREAGKAKSHSDSSLSGEELVERIKFERADAAMQVGQRLEREYEQKLQSEVAALASALVAFEAERIDYYARVEAEIVQLALAIAAKILHREAQVDPMLVAALVRIAVERMSEGSNVTIRVNPGRAKLWREYFTMQVSVQRVVVIEDAEVSNLDCIVETELGTSNFGLDTQLKEVGQGFFDLLALKPVSR